MKGRAKGNQERIIALAHQTQIFAREKKLKPLRAYLGKAGKQVGGEVAVLDMFRKMAADGRGVTIRKITRTSGKTPAS